MASRSSDRYPMNLVKANKWQRGILLIPLVVDAMDWVFFEEINGKILAVMREPSLFSIYVILVTYTVFVLAVVLLNLLESEYQVALFSFIDLEESKSIGSRRLKNTSKTTFPDLIFLYPTAGLGVIMILLTVYSSGITGDEMVVSENALAAFVFTGFIIFCLHLLLLANPLKPRLRSGTAGYFFLFAVIV